MVLSKKEEGIGVKDFFATNSTAIVKRVEKCWKVGKSIFASG